MSPPVVTIAELQSLLNEESAFARAFEFRVESIEAGGCTILVPFSPLFERPGGIVSGQLLMAAADVAMWLAIKTERGLDDPSVTINLHTTFVRSARRESVRCHARVLKAGGRLSHGTAECRSDDGALLSLHTLSFARPSATGGPPSE
jgi:acyl-coenzyme A thioesterase PaaI-like protein